MINKEPRIKAQKRRHKRIRRKISGSPECPRLCVFRSLKHIYAQIIDDRNSKTLVSASTQDPEVAKDLARGNNRESAKLIGELIAKRAKENNITKVRFDRGGYRYHGRVKELAEAARKEGLDF